MRIIVTGGAGFIGSHLVDKLIKLDHKVIVVDDFSTGDLINLPLGTTVYGCDVAEYNPEEPVDVIYHLAARARIQPSFDSPQETYDANSSGTIAALEWARKFKAKFIYAGSSTAFHDVFANPYAYSKWLGEQHCRLYSKLYDVSTAIARFFNVYGPRQIEGGPFATVIGVFEKQYREGLPLTITGDGTQRRDFTHVSDIVDGLIAMSAETWTGDIFSLGTAKNYSINEVASMFKGHPVEFIPKRPGEAEMTLANLKFTRKALKWKPQIKLADYIGGIVKSS